MKRNPYKRRNEKEKTFCILLSLLLAFSVLALPVSAAGGGVGDIDRDGDVTAADARLILRAVVELETLPVIIPSPEPTVSFAGETSPASPALYARADDWEVYEGALSRYASLMEKADAEADLDRRYVLFAEAESYLLDSAAVLPTTTQGGAFTISHQAPHTVPLAKWGSDDDRLGTMVVTKELIKKTDRDALTALWEKAADGGAAYDPTGYLTSHGYTLGDAHTSTFSTNLRTFDWCSTAAQSDTEILVNTVDGLVQYDNFGRLRPALAESWDISSDGKVYTFHIRPDVYWYSWSGVRFEEVTAYDFETGFHHMLDMEAGLEWLTDGIVKGVGDFLYGPGWGPDYGDPSTYLNTYLPDNMGCMTYTIGLFGKEDDD